MEEFTLCLGSYEITLPIEALEQCYHQGQCAPDCEEWEQKIDWSNVGMTLDQIRSELSGYGAWDEEELSDDKENRIRILWIAAGDYQEAIEEDEIWKK
jgi:hypothetical protein